MKPVYASNGGAVGDGTRITRVSGGGTIFEVMTDIGTGRFAPVKFAAEPAPAPEPVPVVLPEGFVAPATFPIRHADRTTWGSTGTNLSAPAWWGGMSYGSPGHIEVNADLTVDLDFTPGFDRKGYSGKLQRVRHYDEGRTGVVVHPLHGETVFAYFTYHKSGRELDFECVRRDGALWWALNVHMPRKPLPDGTPVSGSVQLNHAGFVLPLVPFTYEPQCLEFDLSMDGCLFFKDGVEVGAVTPDMMPAEANWTVGQMQEHLSMELHGGWVGRTNADYTKARMRVLGVTA